MNFRTRIRTVRLKSGGSVTLLNKKPHDDASDEECRAKIRLSAESVIRDMDGPLRGFVLVAWDKEAGYKLHYRLDMKDSAIGFTLMPAFVHDVLLRERIEDAVKEEAMS
jgi:hypothetical protein